MESQVLRDSGNRRFISYRRNVGTEPNTRSARKVENRLLVQSPMPTWTRFRGQICVLHVINEQNLLETVNDN